jgi:tRNA U34 5-methylaminomethyl-2-thiouridine-forming methyltransferase MnmC
MFPKRIITSSDGSHSIELIGMQEQYHSIHGAMQESYHIFIQNGLANFKDRDSKISILEVGMGTGLNVLLTLDFAKKHSLNIYYLAVEAYPLEPEFWQKLNYGMLVDHSNAENVFEKIHLSPWDKPYQLDESFKFRKHQEFIENMVLAENQYDLVYFDAFNPNLQPELWTEKVFSNIFNSMKDNGVLATYSTKGIVKQALKQSGFEIEKKPGPPGKREILVAHKRANKTTI